MVELTNTWPRARSVAFVGTYLPRACGIATFTHDLAEAMAKEMGTCQSVVVAALSDLPGAYAYPKRVAFEIRRDYPLDYFLAADFLNSSGADVISLQHEYGIFGGEWGSYLLLLIRKLTQPIVMTCHTVAEKTEPLQKEIFTELAERSAKIVAMSDNAVAFLTNIYGVDPGKIVVIPHGIHDVPFVDSSHYKDKFGLQGRTILLTFGLLHCNKGIEYMIEALPSIVERHPQITYLVLGSTHPSILAKEGEAYRLCLQNRVEELGIERNVLFHAQFVDLVELLEYIGAADICVTPYLSKDQIASGALAYAVGSGKAVVSTPYRYAEELLADGRGIIVPPGDSEALSKEILSLLDNPVEFNAMRKRAYQYCRNMTWPATAVKYIKLFDEVLPYTRKAVTAASAAWRSPFS